MTVEYIINSFELWLINHNKPVITENKPIYPVENTQLHMTYTQLRLSTANLTGFCYLRFTLLIKFINRKFKRHE